jgi:outer membrane protein OmpA-like peptidoglycan-associated protein
MAKACPKCKEVECEECPEWIFTLADLIMCMMGLFVILWVLKPEGSPMKGDTSEKKEYVKLAAAIRDAFGYVPDPASPDPVDIEMIAQRMKGERVPRGPGEGGKTERENEGTDGTDREVTRIRQGNNSAVGTALLYDAGSLSLSADGRRQIKAIAEKIRGHRQIVIVKGHTSLDDLPASASESDRLNLSLDRARAVAQLLIAEGIKPEVIRVQGCSTWERAKQRAFGPNAQAVNRRVEVEVSDQLVEERQDPPTVKP